MERTGTGYVEEKDYLTSEQREKFRYLKNMAWVGVLTSVLGGILYSPESKDVGHFVGATMILGSISWSSAYIGRAWQLYSSAKKSKLEAKTE